MGDFVSQNAGLKKKTLRWFTQGQENTHPNLDLVLREFPSLTSLRLANLMRSTTENLKMVGSERSVSAQPSFYHYYHYFFHTRMDSFSELITGQAGHEVTSYTQVIDEKREVKGYKWALSDTSQHQKRHTGTCRSDRSGKTKAKTRHKKPKRCLSGGMA